MWNNAASCIIQSKWEVKDSDFQVWTGKKCVWVRRYPAKQTSSQNVWPWINSAIDLVIKLHEARLFFLIGVSRELWKRGISSASEKVFPVFFWRLLLLLNSIKKRCISTQQLTRSLSTGVGTAWSRLLWPVCWNKVIWVLGHCWVGTTHIHTSEEDTLFFQSCWLATVTVTLRRIMPIEALLWQSKLLPRKYRIISKNRASAAGVDLFSLPMNR